MYTEELPGGITLTISDKVDDVEALTTWLKARIDDAKTPTAQASARLTRDLVLCLQKWVTEGLTEQPDLTIQQALDALPNALPNGFMYAMRLIVGSSTECTPDFPISRCAYQLTATFCDAMSAHITCAARLEKECSIPKEEKN